MPSNPCRVHTRIPSQQQGRCRSASSLIGRSPRTGTTLVELIVALVIITVGLLALAGAAAIVARETATGRREAALAGRTRTRLERLTSVPCALLSGGAANADGVSERWTVSAGRNGMHRLVVTVEAPAQAGPGRTVRRLEGLVACA